MLKKILLASIFVITAITSVTYAEDDMKTVASKAYVDTKIETKQLKIPAAGQPNVGSGETVMTYTATGNGQIGERGLYSDISSYDANTDGDKLITASALNATFTNLPTTPTTKLECANSPACTLWTIVDQTAYAYQLPDGYTRLQYIESTGTQCIDTGISGFNTGNWEIYAKWLLPVATQTNRYAPVFGMYAGEDYNTYRIITNLTDSSRYLIYGNSKAGVGWPGVAGAINQIHTATVRNGSVIFDGETINTPTQGTALPTGSKLGIFCVAGGTSKIIAKIYSVNVKKDGVLIGDFIPAKRDSDDVLGMYDTVSGQFFTNSGTGDFIAGPPAN